MGREDDVEGKVRATGGGQKKSCLFVTSCQDSFGWILSRALQWFVFRVHSFTKDSFT